MVSGASVSDHEEPRETAPGATSRAEEQPVDEADETDKIEPTGGGRSYVVKPGDTLSSIAIGTGVSVEQLQALNPDVDPQALAAGERLKLH